MQLQLHIQSWIAIHFARPPVKSDRVCRSAVDDPACAIGPGSDGFLAVLWSETRHTMALGWLPYLGIFPVTLPYALVNHAIAQTCLPHLKIFLPPHPRIGQLSYVYMASMSWAFSSNLLSNRTDLLSTAWATLPRMTTIPWEQFPNPKNVTFRLLDINFLVSPEPKSWHSEWATWVVLTLWNKRRRLRRMSQRKLKVDWMY